MKKGAKEFLIITLWMGSSIYGTSQEIDYRAKFDEAETFLLQGNFVKALPLYLDLLTYNQNNSNWNFKIGFCYLNSQTEVSKSINYLEKAITAISQHSRDDSYKEDKAPILAFLYLGDAYHRNYRFDEAVNMYKKFESFYSEKDKFIYTLVKRKIEICNDAKELIQSPVTLIRKNMGDNINSPYADYSPIISADESILLLTSRRPENTGGKTDEYGKYFEDIYISYKGEDDNEDKWSKARNVGPSINTDGHEATIGMSIDGQIVFIYKDDPDSGSIYITSMLGDNWTVPEKISGDVNTKYWESHATLSDDGNTLYFTSTRPGGFGGRDIYRCKKLPNGQWSKAMNLGPNVNTPYHEDAPFLQPGTNTLYFSSEGHKNMGGFDIFTTHFIDTGIYGGWTEPVNIGYPINTTGDDVFFVPTIDNKRAYYSSFAQDSYGDKDIYLLIMPEKEESKLTVLRGAVYDDFGKYPEGTFITVTDAETNDIIGTYQPNPKTKRYLFILPHSHSYVIQYEAEGYEPVTNTIRVEPGKAYLETEMVLILKDVILEKKKLGTVRVYGTVTDIQKKTLKDVSISVKDNAKGITLGSYFTDAQGRFSFVLERGSNSNIAFEKDGYLYKSENINLPKEKIYSSLEKNITLEPIAEGSKTVLNNIFFDFNKSKLRSESFVELDKIYALLKEKPEVRVQISGHTDNKGDDKLNTKLSNDRAKAVADYLTKKGISKKRISYKGYGKSQPVASNDTDEGRQLNRRVELQVVRK